MVLFLDFLPGLDLFEIVLFLVEFIPYVVALNVIAVFIVRPSLRKITFCALPLLIIVCVTIVAITSYEHAVKDGYDLTQPSLRDALESYMNTGKGDVHEILYSNRYPPVFGKHELKYLLTDLMSHTLLHLDKHNQENMPVAYNKGNDWFRATLGEPMVYTSAIFTNETKSLMEAQLYKLDYVANALDLQPGDRVLDVGCGWATLVREFTLKYKAHVTGITLSSEQVKYFNESVKPLLPSSSSSSVHLQDAMLMLSSKNPLFKPKSFDKITALEMAEHVGIKRYFEFLKIVNTLLKDDGTFYIQVAGFRRDWRFKDFVWGLFMGEHVFPGADASCPLGWVTTQLERAGFEVQRVSNLGTHYSRTLQSWADEWKLYEKEMKAKYGDKAYRRWEVFLNWSVKIAREGSSTVFMITTTKANQENARVKIQQHLAPVW